MNIRLVESATLPTEWGEFVLHGFEDVENDKTHLALSLGDLSTGEPVLARVHSECLTGDALFSERCDCGYQLQMAMEKIASTGRGVVLYLRQEGRGIGLLNKIRAYHLQDQGADTVEANEQLGFGADMRSYEMLRPMLTALGISKLRLMTNNPRKVAALEEMGFEVTERIAHLTGLNQHNTRYMQTKSNKLGHLFE